MQRISENNESTTQNANIAFQLWAEGQQLELLSRTYKDMKDEVKSIKQHNSGAGHWGNIVRRAVRNARFDFEEFVDETQMQVKITMILHLLAKESGLD
jgi:uncharacterized protein (UPF0335 family)